MRMAKALPVRLGRLLPLSPRLVTWALEAKWLLVEANETSHGGIEWLSMEKELPFVSKLDHAFGRNMVKVETLMKATLTDDPDLGLQITIQV